ncbi:MAG: hypothetical protein O6943_06015, partial [Bacteroidetes bacterium]|nr:hypothetical protein [Bacteroidota bacterium]
IALWNPNIFSGMPWVFGAVSKKQWWAMSIHDLLLSLGKMLNSWEFVYFVVGGFFFYIFLRLLKLSWFAAMLGAIIFVLLPHHLGLINAGHNTKIRAIMTAPVVASSFLYFVTRNGLMSCLLMVLSLTLHAQARHYQIIYYTGFLLLFIGIPYLTEYVKQKDFKKLAMQVGLLISAIVITVVITSPSNILVKQYLTYSIRGGGGETTVGKADGLSLDYATQWSFPPEEIVTLVIPNYFGGSSQYKYSGDAVPDFKGRYIPGYWGSMPFTSTTHYVGILTFIFAVLGCIGFWKKRMIKSLVSLCILTLLVSFGRHFSIIFDLFFKYLPFFDKFRAPSMILYLLHLILPVFAAFGLEMLLSLKKEDWKNRIPILGGTMAVLILLSLGSVLFGSGLALTRPEEIQQYDGQTLALIKTARLDLLKTDAWRLLIFTAMTAGLIWAYFRKIASERVLMLGLSVLVLIDMYTIDWRYLKELGPKRQVAEVIKKTQIDNYILDDKDLFRVFPVNSNLFGDNRWAYFHESIGGYNPAKMHNYQNIIEKNLNIAIEPGVPINWNIVRMLNVKYLVSAQQISSDHIVAVGQDPNTKWVLYKIKNFLPRAWLVYRNRVIPERSMRQQTLNQEDFEPATEAIVKNALLSNAQEEIPDAPNNSVEVNDHAPNSIIIKVDSPSEALLVLSEIYIPIWWKAYVDDNEVEIHEVNTLLRGVVVPEGKHTVKFVLEADMYHASIHVSNILVLLCYLVVASIFLIDKIRPKQGELARTNTSER